MSHNVMCNFTHHPSKTFNFFISGECGGGKLCEDKKCQEIRQTGAVIFAQVICTITATFLSTNAHLISSHLDYEFDVLNSKWTGRYRSPKQLARLILHTLRYIEKKETTWITIAMSTIKTGTNTSTDGELMYQNQNSSKKMGQQGYSGQMEKSGINGPHPSGLILQDYKEYFRMVTAPTPITHHLQEMAQSNQRRLYQTRAKIPVTYFKT